MSSLTAILLWFLSVLGINTGEPCFSTSYISEAAGCMAPAHDAHAKTAPEAQQPALLLSPDTQAVNTDSQDAISNGF